jgi:rhodanese-related sulfurtransferase
MMKHSAQFLALADAARQRITELAPGEVKALVAAGAVLIDVRDKEEFDRGHIDGAVNISRGTLEMRIAEVAADKSARIVCYCGGGNRGALATDTLVRMGYSNAVAIAGGMKAFLEGK